MIVQINTDHNIEGGEGFNKTFADILKEELSRYSNHLTRVEAHLTDEDGNKDGQNDKRCVLETRIEGRPPIAVTCHANSHYEAVSGAIEKLKSTLDTTLGRLKDH